MFRAFRKNNASSVAHRVNAARSVAHRESGTGFKRSCVKHMPGAKRDEDQGNEFPSPSSPGDAEESWPREENDETITEDPTQGKSSPQTECNATDDLNSAEEEKTKERKGRRLRSKRDRICVVL